MIEKLWDDASGVCCKTNPDAMDAEFDRTKSSINIILTQRNLQKIYRKINEIIDYLNKLDKKL